jgi:hypothetical protein
LESPSLYVHDAQVLEDAQALKTWPEGISIGIGTNEEGLVNCDPNRLAGEINREALSDDRRLVPSWSQRVLTSAD